MKNAYLKVLPALRKVSSRLSSMQASEFMDKELHKPSVHLLRARSKMLRPSLVLLGAIAVGEKPDGFVDLAVAAELIHVSSLIHDDIIDGDRKRRGIDSVHVRYGSPAAILAGDALISKAVQTAAKYGAPTLESMSRATMSMCAGEVLDHKYRDAYVVPSVAQYKRIASLKSGALIGACWNSAAVCKSSRLARQMYEAGSDLGMAFQIRDDILDFIRDRRKGSLPAPNVVTSIQKGYSMNMYDAVLKAVELNNRYMDSSARRLAGTREGNILSMYSSFVRVAV